MKFSDLPVYSVSNVNQYIKELMDDDGLLSSLLIRGEVSNYKKYPSGHHYFSLKDEQGSLRCVMFRGDASRLRFQPVNGMQAIAFGRITVFPRDGQYQLYCSELFAAGQGDLNAAFQRLKEHLDKEGLFDPAAKQAIPAFPKKIALVTSPVGAAVRDMLRILKSRWPMAEVLIVPARVQGAEAPGEIAAAIHAVNNRADVDLIITGRGGGSMEDLWAFNEEVVARAIYVSNIPVISAVGHEPDVTISDYVADLRAATPSNAAELAVPDQDEIKELLSTLQRRMERAMQSRLEHSRAQLVRLSRSRVLRDMKAPLDERRMILDHLQQRMTREIFVKLKGDRAGLARLRAGLEAMSPMNVLSRGYAITTHGTKVVSSVSQVQEGDLVSVRVSDGVLSCQVIGKEPNEWQKNN